ncbi:hypothetical protein [Variovorax ginsengisoli]|uniref:Uncharacterized protein n=1 Tax=Variovorax ginsengisoli TaxID=363844 RepID=A0ABT8SC54_9BURK|nr:hypothetical protein [Variovorax ginsengisoli]MDN8616412.1 hypothetical protein [Variovorax ginsengisoli]MDO1535582.1 hypothetical protein [Variovorax ginsengisoli]
MTTTTSTLRFGFAPRAAAPAAAPTAAPAAAPVASAPVAAPVAQSIATSTAPVQEAPVATLAAQAVEGAAGEATQAAVPTEDITIMLSTGGRQGQVFGGVFGRMEGDKFRTDPLLKAIYLLELIDGAVPGGVPGAGRDDEHGEMLEQMGGMPETVTVSVPTDLAASFKATLANLSGARWQQLYEQAGASVNSMVKFALNNEARVAREAVAQIARTGGEVFTVQVAEPKELRFMMIAGDDYDEYDRELSGVPQAVAGSPVVTAVAGEVADAAVGMETFASACGGRQEGDTLTYTHIEHFTVLADTAENAVKVQALVPEGLMTRTAMSAGDVMVNGQPYVLSGPLLEDESATADAPR